MIGKAAGTGYASGSVGIPVCLALRKKRQAGMPVLSGLKIRPEPLTRPLSFDTVRLNVNPSIY